MSILTQITRPRAIASPVVVAVEVEDLTALAVAVGVMAEPAALAAVIDMMTAPGNASTR